ncbi:MAG: hypothetical protein AAGB34_07145 [Planctomycetota bacterium]
MPDNARSIMLCTVFHASAAFLGFSACNAHTPSAPTPDPGTFQVSAETVGQRDDLLAALKYAASAEGFAILDITRRDSDALLVELIDPQDMPAWLYIENAGTNHRFETSTYVEDRPITVSAKVSRLGNPTREEQLIDRLDERLHRLRKGPAPIDWARLLAD